MLGLSGGVDVVTGFAKQVIGSQLTCVLLITVCYVKMNLKKCWNRTKAGLNVIGVEKQRFYKELAGVRPEQKRKIIGKLFISI